MKKFLKRYLLHFVLVVAIISTLMSLYFSEIMKLVPCVLCWYQRIAMYPLVALFTVGIILKDKRVVWYALPLTLFGLGMSIYHNLLYYRILPESIAPCQAGVSCTTQQILWWGWFTIPLGALIAFIVINASLLLFIRLSEKK